jgi:hypothetical protein
MPSQKDDDSGSPWHSQSTNPPDLELLIKRGLAPLKRLLPGGSFGGMSVFFILLLVGLSVWSSITRCPVTLWLLYSDSVSI